MSRRADWLHGTALASLVALFALLMAWILWLDPAPERLRTPVLLVIIGPLLTPLPGLIRRRRYTIAWSTMLILAYFVHGVLYAAGPPPGRWLGLTEALLAVVYFTTAVTYMKTTRTPTAPKARGTDARG